jgi:predicted small secreted protein
MAFCVFGDMLFKKTLETDNILTKINDIFSNQTDKHGSDIKTQKEKKKNLEEKKKN